MITFSHRHAWAVLGCVCTIAASGCSGYMPEMTPFGAVAPPDENRSLNGLGLQQDLWESAGVKCIRPQKLSPRLESADVIVLVGQSYEPPGASARKWLENWLAQEPGRSVVYFGRDLNAELYYRRKTIPGVAPDSRAEAETDAALVEAAELKQRISSLTENTFCGWFYLDTQQPTVELDSFQGPWASDLAGQRGVWPVRTLLLPPDAGDWQSRKPSWLANPANNSSTTPTPVIEGTRAESSFERSRWSVEEMATDERWKQAIEEAHASQVMLEGSDGTPLIYRLGSEDFPGSHVMVVANGAPFLNATLIEPLHRSIAAEIINNCLPADRVAFLAYDQRGILISNTPEQDLRGAGLEMFLVWPLSALTVPLAILAVVACVAMLPILGRPQRMPARSVSDFGLHVNAVSRLLFETRDWHYAATMIDTYFRRIRKEPPPPWVDELIRNHQMRNPTPYSELASKTAAAKGIPPPVAANPGLPATNAPTTNAPAQPPQNIQPHKTQPLEDNLPPLHGNDLRNRPPE